MDVRRRCPVDQEADQFRATVVTACIHHSLAPVDFDKVKIGNHLSFTFHQGLAYRLTIGGNDSGEATARNRSDSSARVVGNLGLLVGVEPCGCADDEAGRFKGMLSGAHLRLLGEKRAEDRAGVHRGVDLLAIGNQGVSCQREIMFPARKLADPADGTVYGAKAGTVALAPDHPLMIGGGDLAATLDQRAVSASNRS